MKNIKEKQINKETVKLEECNDKQFPYVVAAYANKKFRGRIVEVFSKSPEFFKTYEEAAAKFDSAS